MFLFSIIIPTWKKSHTLIKTLEAIRKQKMFKERIEHEKKEKESDEKFRYKVINWFYDDVAINPDDTD